MIRKIILLIFPALFIASFAYSQKPDVIYLKDGSFVRGQISEYKVNEYVRIVTVEGKTVEYPYDQVENIALEGKVEDVLKSRGFFNNSYASLMFGSVAAGVYTVNGYQFNDHWLAGFCTGIETYDMYGTYIPLFADVRYQFLNERFTPFLGAKAGYLLSAGDGYYYYTSSGGPTGGITGGIRLKMNEHFGWTFSSGFRLTYLTRRYIEYDWFNDISYPVKEQSLMPRIELSVGFYFD